MLCTILGKCRITNQICIGQWPLSLGCEALTRYHRGLAVLQGRCK